MGIAMLLLTVGAIALLGGARAAARGATILAPAAGVPTAALGILLFGVHLEPLGTAVAAAGMGQTEIAAGQALGGLLAVLTAAFGVGLLAAPRPTPSPPPAMLAAPALGVAAAALAIADRVVTRLEGGLLVALYVAYTFFVARPSNGAEREEGGEEGDPDADRASPAASRDDGPSRARAGLLVVGGLTALALGAVALVRGGTGLVERTLLLPGFVGAAVVGILAAADQILLVVRSARSEQADPPSGDVFRTLGAVTTGVVGVAALIRPLSVDSGVTVALLAVAFLYAVAATAFFLRGRAGRGLGTVVLASYVAWLLWGSSL